MLTHSLQDKTVYVVGMGITGRSAARFLRQHCKEVFTWDDRTPPQEPNAYPPDQIPWHTIDYCLLSPGIPLHANEPLHPAIVYAKRHAVPIISDIEIFFQISRKTHCAVTGSVGKSTCVDFLAQYMQNIGQSSTPCGNFGKPILDIPDTINIPMIEMSSAQLDLTITPNINVGILLSIFPDHLEFHGGMENYITAKHRIAHLLHPSGLLLCCADYVQPQHRPKHSNLILFSCKNAPNIDIVCHKDSIWHTQQKWSYSYDLPTPLQTLPFMPIYVGMAVAISHHLKVPFQKIQTALQNTLQHYKGLAHRCEYVDTHQNTLFINDSKATSSFATNYALTRYKNVLWICGGRRKNPLKKSDFTKEALDNIQKIYIFGEDKKAFQKTFSSHPQAVFATLDDAVEAAWLDAQKSSASKLTILLSPAATSFDQFPNFTIRGKTFKDKISRIKKAHHPS